jgi:hypothetical protein
MAASTFLRPYGSLLLPKPAIEPVYQYLLHENQTSVGPFGAVRQGNPDK